MQNTRSKHAWACAISALLTLAGCGPRLDDCRTLLPVMEGPVTLVQTPLGTPGCSCVTADVVVVAEARRHYLSFERGAVWIDGTSVSIAEFSTKLDEAKAQHRAERMRAAIAARTRPVRHAIHAFGTTLKHLLQGEHR